MSEQPAIPAATLVVMRDSPDGPPDLLMVERSAGMAFAAGAMVFPGGRVDAADEAFAARLHAPDAAARITAIRETLEETGIAAGFAAPVAHDLALELQRALHDGTPFANLLDRHGLVLDLESLTPFARWRPAFKQPRRFDTCFYLAPAPSGAGEPVPQPGECERAEWLSARAVLDSIAAGRASAIFPTLRNLERLAAMPGFAAAVADAQAHTIETIVPWVEVRGGVETICIPEGLGYPVTAEPLDRATRA